MGTQQVLLIVISVIIVGAAVAVGINMFDTQANNNARNAVVSDIIQMGIQAQAWFRTPIMMGGGGGRFFDTDMQKLLGYLDTKWADPSITDYTTINGSFTFTHRAGNNLLVVGTSNQNPEIVISGLVYLLGGSPADNYGILISSGAP